MHPVKLPESWRRQRNLAEVQLLLPQPSPPSLPLSSPPPPPLPPLVSPARLESSASAWWEGWGVSGAGASSWRSQGQGRRGCDPQAARTWRAEGRGWVWTWGPPGQAAGCAPRWLSGALWGRPRTPGAGTKNKWIIFVCLNHSLCNRVYCIHVPGHDPITFSFRSFSFLIGWGGLWPNYLTC